VTALTAFQAAGGLGLFLLGMIIMTDGLRTLAGGAIRGALVRFTDSPLTGAVTGTVSTAILQSSSATTVAAVGFVGAGLLSFPEALGIIFGASVGTTATGWLVAILGFKLQLGTLMLPLILLGAIVRLFAGGRLASAGYALAGFGLIFVGISMMQEGMGGLGGIITPEHLPGDTLTGRLQLVLIGTIATVITQSSSAGVAVVLTALHAGAVSFPQGAALVIGMEVGTTVTTAMATIGGSVAMKRTGLSHVIFNLFAAGGGLLLLSPYVALWNSASAEALLRNGEIGLVAFHSLFNILGVAVAVPLAGPFSRLIERIVPDRGPAYTRPLDRSLLQQPALALNAVPPAIVAEFFALIGHIKSILKEGAGRRVDLFELESALDETQSFVDDIQLQSAEGREWEQLIEIVHTLDHMRRAHERCEEDEDRAFTARRTPGLEEYCTLLVETINTIIECYGEKRWNRAAEEAKKTADAIHRQVRAIRKESMARLARNEIGMAEMTRRLEAIRWLRRVSKHISRITEHLVRVFVSPS
jgi:phosphate:Na+ symporter